MRFSGKEWWYVYQNRKNLLLLLPMCGRYRRTTSEEELARRYHIAIPLERDLPISWNIVPTQDVFAIRLNPETKQRALDPLRLGLIPSRAKDPKIAYKTINARVETVGYSSVFSGGVQEMT